VDAITVAGLRRDLQFIASDALEGRDTLSPGFRAAAEYIAASLDRIGAVPAGDNHTFFQHVGIRRTSVDADHASLTVGETEFKYGEDYLVPTPGDASGALAFVGQGYRVPNRHLDPFAGVEVKDRVLVITQPPPEVGNLTRGTDYTTAADNARALGASAVVSIVSYQRLAAWTRLREAEEHGKLEIDRLPENDESRPFILAGPRLASALFRGEKLDATKITTHAAAGEVDPSFAFKAGKTVRIHTAASTRVEDTENVVAIIEAPTRCCGTSMRRSALISITWAASPGMRQGARAPAVPARTTSTTAPMTTVRAWCAAADGRSRGGRATAEAVPALRLAHRRGAGSWGGF
jgi:hypothetical protein